MQNLKLKAMQSDLPDYGKLQIHITSARGAEPIPGAKVEISYTGEPQRIMEELTALVRPTRWSWPRRRWNTAWNPVSPSPIQSIPCL